MQLKKSLTMVIITDDTFKYDFELLDSNSDEFKCIKEFISITSTDYLQKLLQIHKVFEINPTNSTVTKRNNLMLFHGTNEKGVERILKEGFKNSEKGCFGKGVYMTDCSTIAVNYSRRVTSNRSNKIRFVFVNEVLKSDTLKTFVFGKHPPVTDIKPKYQFEKHAYLATQQVAKDYYKKDALGRKYRNIPHNLNTPVDEFVADESITIPKYLIEFEDTVSDEIMKNIFLGAFF